MLGVTELPISRDDFEAGIALSDWAKEILNFLRSHPGDAFTSVEIFLGLGYTLRQVERPLEGFFENALPLIGFHMSLNELIRSGKAKRRRVQGEDYYIVAKQKGR